MLGVLVLLVVILLPLWLYNEFYHKRRNLPVGPTPLPFIGNLHTLLRNPPGEAAFLQWRRQYGPIYTFWLASQPAIIVADYAKIIELFQRDSDGVFSGRGVDQRLMSFFKGGNYGVGTSEGDEWREQRRFAMHVFRNFSVGKNLMQEHILTEVASLIEQIEADIDAGVEEHAVAPKIDVSAGSIINAMLFGHRFDGERATGFQELKLISTQVMRDFTPVKLQILMAKIRLYAAFSFFKPRYEALQAKNDKLYTYFERNIEAHRQELSEHGASDAPPTNFVDAFLREKGRRDALGEPHNFSLHQLKIICFDLFLAGQETTATTLVWAVAYLIHHADDQQRMWEELDRVCGSGDRHVTVAERPHLPFTCAVINEVQRVANILPNNVPRRVMQDVVIDGYAVKAGTTIVPQISTVLYDEKIFPEPLKFKPGRFIDESSGQLKKCEELIPFSVGKRQCLGEALARMELILFIANLFHRFKFLLDATPPSLTRLSGGTAQCTPYQCRIERRY